MERPKPDQPSKVDDETSSEDGLTELTEVVDIANVYLVVFKEGVCIFHFEDISTHMDSIRKKVLQLEETLPMSSGK
jgi:magnesium transporter